MSFRYAPDLPPETPDIWTVCDGFHPDKHGLYRTGWIAAAFSSSPAAAKYSAGLCFRKQDGTRGIVLICPGGSVGPVSRSMQVYDGSSWSEKRDATTPIVLRAAGLATYGDIILVGTSAGVYDNSGGNFALRGSSPAAQTLLVARNAVVALGNPGTPSDGWATSDVGDYTNYTTGEAASGNLRQTPGAITAGVVLGDDVIAFKRRGVYRGQYVGGAVKWLWQLIHSGYGAAGPGCAVVMDNKVYFFGDDGFFVFDGSQFQKLDAGISKTLSNAMSANLLGTDGRQYVQMVRDTVNRRICIFMPSLIVSFLPAGYSPIHYSYNVDSGLWGYQSKIYDGTDDIYAVLRGGEYLNAVESGAWDYNTDVIVYSATNSRLENLTTTVSSSNTGSTYTPKLRTYRLGRRDRMTFVNRAIPRWTKSDTAGTDLSTATTKTCTPYTSTSAMKAETAGTAATLTADLYDAYYTQSARFQSAEIAINCEAVIDGVDFIQQDAGAA